ncbi:3-hydroxyacyl-CoA dehydrogenase (plasmid) [Mesorhizobium sp. AR07]|uniref:3-hydroxyacyl-CoA dehydrogenase NAD-binding domain-containing protein n=1 Tax=Mesorhizobium sp. AR07 TaxID=2865838 RepID=UPI002160D314|nr:3-hydroxyacyl-CoA dehydrogenase NAD-binding domain-containing protein [Mesorhizobium sp. AR07]UVK48995.1 3-hydroxyacyl-CoA dehydrogenase [Mesorhizobium sp. AR07]
MSRPEPHNVQRIACIGIGTIGGGMVARFLANGYDVTAYGPGEGSNASLQRTLDHAWPVLERIGLKPGASRERLLFTQDLEQAVADVDFIQESIPEFLDLKVQMYEKLDELVDPSIVIGSSTSGFPMTDIQKRCKHPQRTVVAHPVNPPYLIPLIEVVGGEKTDLAVLDWTVTFFETVGMRVLRMDKEIYGFMINRLQIALFREALHMIAAEQATVAQIDDCLTHGLGLRWAFMGPFATFHLGGGDGGLEAFMDIHGAVEWRAPYVTESPLPDWTPELRERILQQAQEVIDGRTIPQMIEERNETIIGLLKLREASRINASKKCIS